MGILKPGAGLAIAMAAGAMAFSPGSPLATTQQAAEVQAGERYRVLDAGRDTGCELDLGEAQPDGRTRLLLGRGCKGEGLGNLHFWSDLTDGTVALLDEGGAVTMRLTAADGAAFEAYGAGAPLIALVQH